MTLTPTITGSATHWELVNFHHELVRESKKQASEMDCQGSDKTDEYGYNYCSTCYEMTVRRFEQLWDTEQPIGLFPAIVASDIIVEFKERTEPEYLGGKGASLYRMSQAGMPVPSWMTIPCEWSRKVDALPELRESLDAQMSWTFPSFGDEEDPTLVSVRSGAPVSMPGMMDTILNVGINDKTVKTLAEQTSPDFAWDCYRRLVMQYATIVLDMDKQLFEQAYQQAKIVSETTSGLLPADYSAALVKFYRSANMMGKKFPQNVQKQLDESIKAVWRSWNSERALYYRRTEGISSELGTAVTIQKMVFGNRDDDSLTGIFFSRNPNTGVREPFGEWLANAQGEDVVSGDYRTKSIDTLPAQHLADMIGMCEKLEPMYDGQAVDTEFTVESGKLYILQARAIKATPQAKLRMVLDDYRDGDIEPDAAMESINDIGPVDIVPTVDTSSKTALGTGTPCAPGIVTGRITHQVHKLREYKNQGHNVIFVANATSPEDIEAMDVADAILTMNGGPTCHAAVTARGWGKVCVVGFGGSASYNGSFAYEGTQYNEGRFITVNGSTGEVFV